MLKKWACFIIFFVCVSHFLVIVAGRSSFADDVVFSANDVKDVFQVFDYKKFEIGYDKFMTWYDNDQTVILDLRSRDAYEYSHIKGAVHFGADIEEGKLLELVPSKDARIVVYCTNSIMPTRIISLTHTSLPQFHALGYENTYMLGALWQESGGLDVVKKLPMTEER